MLAGWHRLVWLWGLGNMVAGWGLKWLLAGVYVGGSLGMDAADACWLVQVGCSCCGVVMVAVS
jgi:hypothetical protein